MLQKEIERKFLVTNDGWRNRSKGMLMRQGYLCKADNRSVRVRTVNSKGFLNIKVGKNPITREEFEYEIPFDEASTLLNNLKQQEIIEKLRYIFEESGSRWEVDEFLGANEGLIVAEIELPSEDQYFEHPNWLGKEVSSLSRYLNTELSVYPYSEWSPEDKI